MATLLTPDEAAERLRVKVTTVTHWLRDGVIPGVKIGHFWRIPEDKLNRLIDENQERTPKEGGAGKSRARRKPA